MEIQMRIDDDDDDNNKFSVRVPACVWERYNTYTFI